MHLVAFAPVPTTSVKRPAGQKTHGAPSRDSFPTTQSLQPLPAIASFVSERKADKAAQFSVHAETQRKAETESGWTLTVLKRLRPGRAAFAGGLVAFRNLADPVAHDALRQPAARRRSDRAFGAGLHQALATMKFCSEFDGSRRLISVPELLPGLQRPPAMLP